ncbi:Short-chain dehydrogenase/reductase SDR [Penicillium taxi]|uniref:Short-chain dehydrogenase/reductase SDR n=1 Tax=Penicillium taxi TaxID=168475 RepID=UPI0025457DF2|nr:Short-chain dehydrogenase/reductase SDR [Penicillium taxi]KAJ5899168.1 Short-chain dehydrogenase/reductase SDR [Penicillium taxi]
MSDNKTSQRQEDTYILVTGANSGLGFSICCRLADEFLSLHPETGLLHIIFTTRSSRKAEDTRRRLEKHLRGSAPSATSRVRFVSESVDLSKLVSVRALSRRLLQSTPKLDAVVLNAGIGGWSGISWPDAIWGVCTDLIQQVTWPTYKLSPIGVLSEKQTDLQEEPPLGMVFCANVFGHYMLAHNVAPLLKRARTNGPGRVIWVSSIEATIKAFDVNDIQGLRSALPYESSKALTDILALTSNLPSTAPWAVDSFLHSDEDKESEPPGIYVSHPGICATAIIPLALPLIWAMVITFWGARMLGSPWHTLSTYVGACSSVFLALTTKDELDAAEAPYHQAGGGRAKWGSSADRLGAAHTLSTEVEGWGYGGVVGTPTVEADRLRRRKRGAKDLTSEGKEQFEELGRQCWKQMEDLRIKWDAILDQAENGSE